MKTINLISVFLFLVIVGTLVFGQGDRARYAPPFSQSLSAEIGVTVQGYDADLTTYAGITPSANVQTMLGSANNAAILSNIGAEPALTDKASLVATLSDVTAIITDDDMVTAGTDPDLSASGQISVDTDGANEPNQVVLRSADTGGDTQYCVGQSVYTIQKTIISPDTLDAVDLAPFWTNTFGMNFIITEWQAWSDDDDVSLEIEELTSATNFSSPVLVDAVEINENGTGCFYDSNDVITHATIEPNHLLDFDFDVTDTPDYVFICIIGYFDANVD